MPKSNQPLTANQASHSMVNSDKSLEHSDVLTEEETKKILTPFAFSIDESLFGIPLAVPWRRGFALFIDFILIAILSGAPGELLAIVVAITFYRIGNVKKRDKAGKLKTFKRTLFKFLGAFIIFMVLVDTLPTVFNSSDSDNTNISEDTHSAIGWAEGIALGVLSTGAYQKINASACQDTTCWQSELLPFVEELPSLTKSEETVNTLIKTMVATIDEKKKLSKENEEVLEQYFFSQYQQFKSKQTSAETLAKPENIAPLVQTENTENVASQEDKDTVVYKGVEWLKGLIEDLGLGFGWAAFYFTVLTSIWHGQTPGKKVFKIRVIQLDGTRLSLWDSFGRYGGYGAGLATGLLGFLQIYWDPNRQAIHDKISATIVIDVKKFEQMKNRKIDKDKV